MYGVRSRPAPVSPPPPYLMHALVRVSERRHHTAGGCGVVFGLRAMCVRTVGPVAGPRVCFDE